MVGTIENSSVVYVSFPFSGNIVVLYPFISPMLNMNVTTTGAPIIQIESKAYMYDLDLGI